MALSGWATPTGMLGLTGLTAREASLAEVTVRTVFPENPPELAVMVALPGATAVARPPLVTAATDGLDELQATCGGGITWLVPSE